MTTSVAERQKILDQVDQEIRDGRVLSVRPSRTGTSIQVRIRFKNRTSTFSGRVRTFKHLSSLDMAENIATSLFVGPLAKLKGHQTVYVRNEAGELGRLLLANADSRNKIKSFISDISRLVKPVLEQGLHTEAKGRFDKGKAKKGLQNWIRHSLQKGVTDLEIKEILKECLTEDIMES